ncbi:MAG TPA: O-antigen ligase family protein [Phycisphaerae bacterium]|nr:O-antigen ligase family protein [Phycisphaerae bacterium]
MNTEIALAATHTDPPGSAARTCSRTALLLAWLLLAGTFFLLSPPPGQTYPGAIPWSPHSLLHRLTEWMSLNGRLATVRGVEVKDLVFHLAAALGMLLLAACTLLTRAAVGPLRSGPAGSAQLLLAGWVLLSLLSSLWAGDAAIARGQALLYALHLCWAVSLAGTLQRRHLPGLLHGLTAISALGAVLCIWYVHERNPAHRPGFPIGNPNVLAAVLLPGVLIAVATGVSAVLEFVRERRRGALGRAAWAGVMLVPLIWCQVLTGARGALLGLAAGLVVIGLFQVGRRPRWALSLVFVLGVMGAGTWWFHSSHLDVTMARGATVRFRIYAWRYASELWNASSWARMAGQGAGSYPRLAGVYAVRDRALDPAAFMGEIVEHAHNEVLEVLTEIGLLGGVTYVGGFVASLFAASALLRASTPGRERWLHLALTGSIAALMADALTGVSLRLPGAAPILFTLLGALWAVAGPLTPRGAGAASHAAGTPAKHSWVLAALVCLAASGAAGWAGLRNWSGVVAEQAASVAELRQDYAAAEAAIRVAESRLLDPVRVTAARKAALEYRVGMAREAMRAFIAEPSPATAAKAAPLAEAAYGEALELTQVTPALEQTDATAARCAEWLAVVNGQAAPQAAAEWAERARRAWLRQRERTPFDVDTLLALTRYPAGLDAHVGLLRDALRFMDTLPFVAESRRGAQQFWTHVLRQLGSQPGFEVVLSQFVAAAGPITPETDIEAIIASRAGETQRLAAAWLALRGDLAGAAERAARAAELYAPLRPRFPTLQSVALAEQADYLLRGGAARAEEAARLVDEAIRRLPVIQEQKYEELVGPFQRQLAFSRLAAGQLEEGLQAIGATPESTADALERLLAEATARGSPAEVLDCVRATLCPRFPVLCGPATSSGSPG